MNDVWSSALENLGKSLVDTLRAISVLETRVVDDMQGNAWVVRILLLMQAKIGREGVFFASKDVNIVPLGKGVT